MSATTLRVFARENVSLTTAIGTSDDAVALVYTPTRCAVGRVRGPEMEVHASLDLATAFEVRCFTRDVEVRWVQTGADRSGAIGTAVLLTELPREESADEWAPVEPPLPVIDCIDECYLLWGTIVPTTERDGWVRTWEARVDPIDVPLSGSVASPGQRLALNVRQYVCEDAHGNAYVAEERLLGIDVYREQR